MPTLTWRGVTARRMARSLLAEPATDVPPADVARAMCGVHAQILQAAELSIGRRNRHDALGRPAGAVGRSHAGEDLRPARDRAPAGDRRPADVDRRPVGAAVVGAGLPGADPLHARGDRGRHRGDRGGARRRGADDRRAHRGAPRARRAVGGRGDDAGVPGPVAALAAAHEHRGASRRAVLRARPRPERDLHEPAPLAARLRARGRRHRAAHARARLPPCVRPGDAAALREVAQRPAQARRRGVRGDGGRAGARRARGDAGLGGRRRHVGAGGRRRRGSGCCRTSTRTSWRRSRASGCTRARRVPGPSARQARRATTR